MAIKLIVVGKTKEAFFQKSETEYLKRLQKYCKLQYIEVQASKKSEKRDVCLKKEESSILKKLADQDFVVLLDENGHEYSSRKFAQQLNSKLVGEANLVFIIGGAFGFSDTVQQRGNTKWSLSKLTMPHHLVRTVFLEQLYRAFTILSGAQYHND